MSDFWRDPTLHPDIPLLVRDTLREIGHESIIKLQIGRTPVQSVVRTLGDFLSNKRFSNTVLELGYDELWHNYLLITIRTHTKYGTLSKLIQKNESIGATKVYLLEKGPRVQLKPAMPEQCVHTFDIPLGSKHLTVEDLIRTAICMDPAFFIYDALNMNTCQTFVQKILDANDLTDHITDEETILAVKPQDASALMTALGTFKDLPLFITDLASYVNKLICDQRIKLTSKTSGESPRKWYASSIEFNH